MTPLSKLILACQLRPIRMHRQEARMRLGQGCEAKGGLRLSQFAADCLPVGPLSRGSVWHRSGEAA
ncbi:hypothetical protein HNR01_001749 [Methylorubrum rhodesianum]|uniref:hypothetical protein n=1 Tax=Methylorubrum rhodesianum TaxID=29427 RepID=UPI00160D98CE|nr:hypothetical protein [Methylorubrum rhodesianum]MBB5762129.1 hypothetical protein [Methylorubrum rhodesianum]